MGGHERSQNGRALSGIGGVGLQGPGNTVERQTQNLPKYLFASVALS